MTPEAIKGHGKVLRNKIGRLADQSLVKSYKPLQDVLSYADDLCELIIALAENQEELASRLKENALDPSEDT